MLHSHARPRWARPLGAFLALFGLLSIKEGGSVLIGDPAAVAAAGAYVPFVVWFNAAAGFAYIVAGIGIWRDERWGAALAAAIACATVAVFAAFGVRVLCGGAYEMRTLVAMALRSAIWIGVAALTVRHLRAPPPRLA